MTKVIKEIAVDVTCQNQTKTIIAKQGDMNSRFLKITITNDGIPINITPSSTVTINARRQDGLAKVFRGDIDESGKITMEINNWMLQLSGIIKCDISIIEENSRLTSFDFFIDCIPSSCPMNDISNADNFDILYSLMTKVESLLSNSAIEELIRVVDINTLNISKIASRVTKLEKTSFSGGNSILGVAKLGEMVIGRES